MRKKTLVVIIENYVSGGANKYAEDLIYCLKDNFEKIEILGNPKALEAFDKARLPADIQLKQIAIFNTGELVKNQKGLFQKTVKLVLIPLFFFLNVLSLIFLNVRMLLQKPELLILCNGGYPASLYLDLAAFFLNSKNIFMSIVSTPIRNEKHIIKYFWKLLDQLVLNNCKRIIVNSSAIKKDLLAYGFPEQKIAILRNGIFDEAANKKNDVNTIRLGFISRIERAKGIEELLMAYSNLRKRYSNISLTIAGSGSLSEQVKQAAQSDPSINYLGHLSSGISELLQEIDIFILPSYQEGLPYSIIEACMAECAIVASDVGGIPEIVEHEKTGLLIPPKNAHALYNAVEKLILNDTERKSLAKNARSFFLCNLSMDKMQEEAKKIFL